MKVINRELSSLPQIPGVFKSVIAVALIQLASAGIIFLSGVVLAHTLGPVGFGAYDFADVWAEILMFLGLVGFDRLLILKVAVYHAKQEWSLLRGILKYTWYISLLINCLVIPVAISLILLRFHYTSPFLTSGSTDLNTPKSYENQLMINTFLWAMVLLPLRTMLKLNQVNLQGLHATVLGYIPEYILRPLFLLVLVLGLGLQFHIEAFQAMMLHVVVAFIAVLISQYFLRQQMPIEAIKVKPSPIQREWFFKTIVFMFISVFSLLNVRGGGAVLGFVGDLRTIALYGVAARLTLLISLGVSASSAVLAPRVAILYEAGKMKELQDLTTKSTRLMTLLALPLALILTIWGKQILSIFGSEYQEAHIALIILCIGQIFNAATGINSWIVMMTNHEHIVAWIFVFGGFIHIFGLFLLSPLFGLEGAAFATSFSTIFICITLSLYAYIKIGINSTPF